MSENDDIKRKITPEEDEGDEGKTGSSGGAGFHSVTHQEEGEEGEGKAGSGGAAGEVVFRYKDPYSISPRDDELPPEEIKRLLIVHKDYHKGNVDKQKATRKERVALKEGKILHYRSGMGLGGSGGFISKFENHPTLSQKAQFSGIDKQVIGLPNENDAKTNPELREKLENRLQLRLGQRQTFNPKPRPM